MIFFETLYFSLPNKYAVYFIRGQFLNFDVFFLKLEIFGFFEYTILLVKVSSPLIFLCSIAVPMCTQFRYRRQKQLNGNFNQYV